MDDWTFWDGREDVPVFASSYPLFHPLGFLARLIIPSEYSAWVTAVLILFSLATCIGALKMFLVHPDRKRWALLVLAFALAILADRSGKVMPLVLAAAVILAWRFTSFRILLAAFIAVLITAFWWLPVRLLQQHPAPERVSGVARFVFAEDFAEADHVPEKTLQEAGASLQQPPRGGGVTIASNHPGRAHIRTATAGWNLLVTPLPAWPGWRVYWNGQRLPPVMAGDRVAAFVPPGDGDLRFRYRPDAFDVGLRVAGLGLILFLITLGWRHEVGARVSKFLRTLKRKARLPVGAVALLLLAVYTGVLFTKRVRVAGGSDSSGYLNQARMWARGDLSIPLDLWRELRLPADYVHSFPPLGFVAARQIGAMVPTYPIGTPLLLAILRILGGDAAMFLIGPLAALTALVLMFLLARRVGLPRGYACAAAAVLAVCPVFVFNALYPVSDILAVVWAVAAVLAAYRAGESWRWGFLAAAAIGIGVLIRPSQLMLLPAIAMATRFRPKPLLAIVAGGLPFAFIQLGLANHFYGSPFRTGYGDADSLFHFANLPARLGDYGYWLARLLPVVFPLGLAALFLKRIDRTTRAVLGAWFLSFLFFYCFYDVFGEWGATRFLLPAMPAVILLFLLGIREVLGERHRIAAGIIAVILAGELVQGRSFGVLGPAQGDEIYRLSVTEARKLMNAPPLVIGTEMTGAYLYYNGETMIRLDSLHPDRFETLRAYASIAGRKWYALVPYFEVTDLKLRAPGNWVPIARFRDVTLFELQSPDNNQ